MTRHSADIAAARLRESKDWQETLAAAVRAFEVVQRMARQHDMSGADLADAFMATAGAAADGLDAVAAFPVPALPPGTGAHGDLAEDIECTADAIAELASVLGEKLDQVWAQLPDGELRTACQDAARSAWDIHDLIAAVDRDVR